MSQNNRAATLTERAAAAARAELRGERENMLGAIGIAGPAPLSRAREVPERWTFLFVMERMEEGFRILSRLPLPTRPKGYINSMPIYLHDQADLNAQLETYELERLARTRNRVRILPSPVLQQGRKAQYIIGTNPTVPRNIVNGGAGTLSGPSPTLSTFSLANFVPPTASLARLLISTSYLGFGTGTIMVAPNSNWGGAGNGPTGGNGSVYPFYFSGGGGPSQSDGLIELMIEGSNPGWASNANSGAVSILGWEDNL